MSIDYEKLNNEQIKAVKTTEGPVLVLSGAGTGKTRVLKERIHHILFLGLAKGWQILVLTFTNKAANEMKSRLHNNISDDFHTWVDEIWCGTFHSICLRILRRDAARIGLQQNFLIFGEDDQKAILKNVITNLGLDIKNYNPSDWVEKISFEKDKGIQDKRSNQELNFDKIYTAYNEELKRLNGLDFGDLIIKGLELFNCAPDILEKYQNQFKYIMVDEFQDTNTAQMQLLKKLSEKNKNICCVGDDDQSIYSWRGAQIKNILDFEKTFPKPEIIRLETNYRSTPAILGVANSLIRHNMGRLGKDLRCQDDTMFGEKVHILTLPTDWDESRIIAGAILNSVRKKSVSKNTFEKRYQEHTNNQWYWKKCEDFLPPDNLMRFSDIAILIRSGSLSRAFEEEFTTRGIPYRLVGAVKFYDRMEIRDVIAYIRLLVYPFDDLSFLRIIGKPRRGFGDSTIANLRISGGNLMSVLRVANLRGKQRASADDFLKSFDFDWEVMAPTDAVSKLLDDTGYLKMWHESKDTNASERLANINELLGNVISKYDSLSGFLEHAALMITEDEGPEIGEAVNIMTIHAAKGLEFDTVFLPAWEEGIFPNDIAIRDGDIEEERRLAYVAITRARHRCVISHAISRMIFGKREYKSPSRFINEIDTSFVEKLGQGINPYARPTESKKEIIKSVPKKKSFTHNNLVGKLVSHAELGSGVVIEESGEILTIAFRTKGIKNVAKKFIKL